MSLPSRENGGSPPEVPLTSGPLVASGAGGRTPCAEGCARQEMGKWTLNGLPHSAAFTTKLGQHLGRPVSEAEKGSHWPPQVSQAQTVLPPRPLQRRSREGRRGGKRLIAAQVKVQSLLGVGAAQPAEAFLDSQEWAGVFSAPPWPNARTGVKTSPKPRGRALPPRVQTVVHRGPLLPAHTCPAHTCASSRPPGPANGHLLSGPRLTCPF